MPLRPGTRHASKLLAAARSSLNGDVLRDLVSVQCYRRALFERSRSKLGISDGDLAARLKSDPKGKEVQEGGSEEAKCLSTVPAVQRKRFYALAGLDRWWQTDYPALVASRSDGEDGTYPYGYITLDDLVQVMEWKVSRNKYRPLVSWSSTRERPHFR